MQEPLPIYTKPLI